LMLVYPIFCVLTFGAGLAWALPGVSLFEPAGYRFETGQTVSSGSGVALAILTAIQFVFGFSAIVAVQSVNWGATLRDRRDVVWSGRVGVALASSVLAAVALIIVAGALGRASENLPDAIELTTEPGRLVTAEVPHSARASDYTLGHVFERQIGGIPGGTGLIVLGLASMASAVYACYGYSNRLEAIRKRPRRWVWGVLGALIAFPLEISGLAANVPLMIDFTAGLVAPMLGILAAEQLRCPASWPGPRLGFDRANLSAWVLGAGLGLLPVFDRMIGGLGSSRWVPAAVLGFAVAFACSFVWERSRT